MYNNKELGRLLRKFRLLNPYSENSTEYTIYEQQIEYNIPLLLFIIWMLTWINTPSETENGQEIKHPYHLHHWMIALLGFFLSKDSRMYSDIGSGIFWGIFCQELASYGIGMPVNTKYMYN